MAFFYKYQQLDMLLVYWKIKVFEIFHLQYLKDHGAFDGHQFYAFFKYRGKNGLDV